MIVRQVRQAFELLNFFAEKQQAATISEIAEHFGWPRSSTFNLVETLSGLGLLHEPRHRQGYFPTHRLLDLATATQTRDMLPEALQDVVDNVAETTGETTAFVAMSGNAAVFLHVVESRQPIRYFASVGQRVPLHATASGRALLSLLSDGERRKLLSKTSFERYSSETLMSVHEIEAEIANSRARGYFLNDNGFVPDLAGVSVPVSVDGRQLSLLVAGPSSRLAPRFEALAKELTTAVRNL